MIPEDAKQVWHELYEEQRTVTGAVVLLGIVLMGSGWALGRWDVYRVGLVLAGATMVGEGIWDRGATGIAEAVIGAYLLVQAYPL